ncbi:MAG TPA: hypothetical protein VK031_09870 [Tissierellaceae bacterium]|nr:hypothetical protein [Tissierellaceae bacterium]
MNVKYVKPVSLRSTLPDDLPKCFGVGFDPKNTECLQCTAFNRCALDVLQKDDGNYYLDQVVEISDKDITKFIGLEKPVQEVVDYIKNTTKMKDKIAIQNRLKRYIQRNETTVEGKNIKVL